MSIRGSISWACKSALKKHKARINVLWLGQGLAALQRNGAAKAALESPTRYLAYDFGPQKIRVNAISAGPIRTRAAAGVGGFRDMYKYFADMSPLRENVTIDDVGNAAVFLASNLSARITGEVLYVDSGFNTIGVQIRAKEEKELFDKHDSYRSI